MLRIAFSMSTEEVFTPPALVHSSGTLTEFASSSSGVTFHASTFALRWQAVPASSPLRHLRASELRRRHHRGLQWQTTYTSLPGFAGHRCRAHKEWRG